MRADSNVVITGNMVMYSKGYGLALMSNRTNFKKTPTKNVVVTGNVITHNRGNADDASQATVMVSGLYKSLIGNNILGHSTGVNATNGVIRFIGDNSDVQIIGNNIYSSQFGILIASCDSLSNIDITNNVFGRGNNGALAMGIRIASCDQGNYMKIEGNTFYDGTTGIRIFSDYPSYMTIKDNEFYNTTYKVTNEGAIVNHNIEYKGVSAFTTTALRKAIFVDGMNTDYNIIVTPIATSTLGYPVAADLIVGFARADSIVFLRSTGTTSGLTFKYIVNND
jgi:hypothetical protein